MFDFTKNMVVDSLDPVPVDFRGLYVEHEGKYKVDTNDPKVKGAVAALVGAHNALASERARTKTIESKVVDLSALAEYGDSPESILSTFNTRLSEATKINQKDAVQNALTSARKEWDEANKVTIKGLQDQVVSRTTQLYERIVNSDATAALAELGALAPELMLPHVSQQVKVDETEGKLQAYVMDPNTGERRFSPTAGKYMSIKELVAEMKGQERYKVFFKSEQASGGGKRPDTPAAKPARTGDLTGIEKIAEGLNKGQHTRA